MLVDELDERLGRTVGRTGDELDKLDKELENLACYCYEVSRSTKNVHLSNLEKDDLIRVFRELMRCLLSLPCNCETVSRISRDSH